MADDNALKSSYELAMERFKKSDTEAGVEPRTLTDEQKAAIAEVRSFYKAKLAELEILHQGQMRQTRDPAERATLEEHYQRERERLTSEREAKSRRNFLSGRGYRAVVSSSHGPKGPVLYRVRVGPYASREEASRAAEGLERKEKARTWIVPPGE